MLSVQSHTPAQTEEAADFDRMKKEVCVGPFNYPSKLSFSVND
jgi:hypothetical protein